MKTISDAVSTQQASDETLDQIFNVSPAFMTFLRGPEFIFDRANEKYYQLIGRRDLIGHKVMDVIPEVEAQGFISLLKNVYETKKPFIGSEIPLDLKHTDEGKPKKAYLDFVYQPLMDQNGDVIGVIAQGYDVTEKVLARKALEQSEQKLRSMIDAIPQMVWSTLPDGFHDYYNKRWYEFTGVPEGSTDGVGWNDMFHPEDQELAWKKWRHSLETGEPYEIEYRLKHHSGQYRWTLGRALPVRDEDGQIVRWMGTCTDIQEQKVAEEALQKSRENLENTVEVRTRNLTILNEELEAFSYSVSHDLRTPLRSIEGFSQALLEDEFDRLSDRGQKDLKRVINASQNMSRLIDDLLTLSRLSRKEMNQKTVHLSPIARIIALKLQEANPGRQVQIEIKDTPAVSGDPGLLEVALENLLANAWKFTAVREKAEISFSSEIVNGESVFVVRDNGAGFDMSFYDKLFGAFQRLHKTTEFSGTGVGLALVRRIINRHGGKVWAEGRVDGGAAFSFKLPLAK